MRWLLVVAAAGCYSPALAPCNVTCGPTSPCPADLTCAADGHCHADGDRITCSVALDITTDGTGEGRIRSTPAGVDCTSSSAGTGCDMIPFAAGTMIELTETHASGNTFHGWSGDACAGITASTCAFEILATMTINATFD